MKNLLVLIIIILVSCNTYNDKMNNLLQAKADLESKLTASDSLGELYNTERNKIRDASKLSSYKSLSEYLIQARLIRNSPEHKRISDSVSKYVKISSIYQIQLKKVVYSIDSLSKLK